MTHTFCMKKANRRGEGKGNRLFFLFFAVFLELFTVAVGAITLSSAFALARAAATALAVLSLLHLQGTPMPFECKYSWAVFLLLFPSFAPVAYWTLSRPVLGRKKKRLLSEIYLAGKPYRLPEDYPKKGYLSLQTGFLPEKRDEVEYFSMGEPFFFALKEELNRAEKFIFLEYFILADGKLWREIKKILSEKAKNGVEIRILYDDFGSLRRISPHFCREMRDLGIKSKPFHLTRPVLSPFANNRDHRKIAIVDGKTAFLGGANIGDEYVNEEERFGVWKDAGVKITGRSVKGITLLFLEMWAYAVGKVESFEPFLRVRYPVFAEGTLVQPFGDGPRPVYGEAIAENLYASLIENVKGSVCIMTPYLILPERIKRALILAAMRGVKVEIFLPGIPDKKAVYRMTRRYAAELINRCVYVYMYKIGFLHSKVMLCDRKSGIVGTVNMDFRSLYHHYECGVYLKGEACKKIEEDFDRLREQSERLEKGKIGVAERAITSLGVLLAPLL